MNGLHARKERIQLLKLAWAAEEKNAERLNTNRTVLITTISIVLAVAALGIGDIKKILELGACRA